MSTDPEPLIVRTNVDEAWLSCRQFEELVILVVACRHSGDCEVPLAPLEMANLITTLRRLRTQAEGSYRIDPKNWANVAEPVALSVTWSNESITLLFEEIGEFEIPVVLNPQQLETFVDMLVASQSREGGGRA